MAKKRSLPSLKKKLWKLFSLYIRNRGSQDGFNSCITCGAWKDIRELHAGHYLHGHAKASFLVEENVHPQCVKCNHFLSGNLLEYHDFMVRTYGQEKIDELKRLSKQIWKPSRTELEILIKKYATPQ